MHVLLVAALALAPFATAGTSADANFGSVGATDISGVVDVPLLMGPYGDELPYVEVKFKAEDTKSWLFRVDLGEPGITLNCDLAKDLGLDKKNHNKKFWKSLGAKKPAYGPAGKQPTVAVEQLLIGQGLVLKDITMACSGVDQNPLDLNENLNPVAGVIGSGALPLVIAILPSKGLVRFAPPAQADTLFADIGNKTVEFKKIEGRYVKTGFGKEYQQPQVGALQLKVGGEPLMLGISTGELAGSVPMSALKEKQASYRIGDLDVLRAEVATDSGPLGTGWFTHNDLGAMPYETIQGTVGYDVLRAYDIVIDPVNSKIGWSKASAQKRAESFAIALAAIQADIDKASKPPEEGKTLTPEEELAAAKKLAGMNVERAQYLMLAGKTQEALPLLQKATEADPNNCSYWKHMGQAWWYAGSVDQAAQATQKSIDLYKSWADLPLKEREKIGKMSEEEQKAAGKYPQELDSCHDSAGQLALIELGRGKNATAIELYNKYIDLDPGLPLAAGIAMLAEGKAEQAQGPLRQALKLSAPAAEAGLVYKLSVRLGLAQAFLASNDPVTSAQNWEAASFVLAYDPLALAFYTEIVKKGPGEPKVLCSLHKLLGRYPDSAPLHAAIAAELKVLGKADESANAQKDALALFLEQVEFRPTNAAAWGLLAWHQASTGDLGAAEISATKALSFQASEPYALLTMATIEATRNPEKARELRQKARGFGALNASFALLPLN